jgi:hypothetical protein
MPPLPSSFPADLLLKVVWTSVAACVGGIVYFIGRSMEHDAQRKKDAIVAVWKKYRLEEDKIFECAIEEQESKLERGFKMMMWGIRLEILTAIGLTIAAACEGWQIKIEMAKNNARNWPLMTAEAFVTIRYQTNDSVPVFGAESPGLMAIFSNEPNRLRLFAATNNHEHSKIDLIADIPQEIMTRESGSGGLPDFFECSFHFIWDPRMRHFNKEMEQFLWHRTNELAAGIISGSEIGAELEMPLLKPKTHILGGSVDIILNGAERDIPIPPQWTSISKTIVCPNTNALNAAFIKALSDPNSFH